jgi:hypothetical protein
MPKLVILTACERVLIERVSSLPSLINIFQRMDVQVIPDTPIAPNAVAAIRWAVFALWMHTPEERGIEYTQRTEIVGASGNKFIDVVNKFSITDADDLQSKNHIDVLGLPIDTEGFVKIRIWLEGVADTSAEYQFAVRHQSQKKETHENAANSNPAI